MRLEVQFLAALNLFFCTNTARVNPLLSPAGHQASHSPLLRVSAQAGDRGDARPAGEGSRAEEEEEVPCETTEGLRQVHLPGKHTHHTLCERE